MLEQGETFLLLRSTETASTYVVRLQVTRQGEELQASSLSAILDSGQKVLGAGDRERETTRSPNGREARVRAKPGETGKLVFKAVTRTWQDAKTIAAAVGVTDAKATSALEVLTRNGAIDMKQVPRDPQHPNGLRKNLYRLPPKTDGPLPPATREYADKIVEILAGTPNLNTRQLNERLGYDGQSTILYDALRALNHRGLIRIDEEKFAEEDSGGRKVTRKRRVYSLPQEEPNGPGSSQRSSEPSQGPSNAGL